MRAEYFWLLSLCGFAALSLVCGLLIWPQLSAVWPSIEEKIDRFRRLPPLAKVAVIMFVGVFVVYGSTKTNQVDQVKGEGEGEQWNLPTCSAGHPEQEFNLLCSSSPLAFTSPIPHVTPEDIARGWQQVEVRTNCNISYTMPEGAVLASNWWVRGAYEDVKPFDFGSWRFPFGTNEYSSLWAFSWGKIRFTLTDTNEIVAVGAPMSAVPYRSRLWSATDTNGSQLVTWENFALNRDTNTPVNAQIELRTTGDFIVRSNGVERVYRRVDDFDWDGDGVPNWIDWDPCWYDGDGTGQPEGWAEYVDEMVGTGLENGYYKLAATFPQEGFQRTVLTVGIEQVVVAEPGEYVFLLEKGVEYELGLEPFADGVGFEAVDDIPGPRPMLLAGSSPQWAGVWSEDGGRKTLCAPTAGGGGRVLWMPTLRVSPGGWCPDDCNPQTFTATLADATDQIADAYFYWTALDAALDVSVCAPNGGTAEITWDGEQQTPGPAALVETYVAGEWLEAELVFGFSGAGGDETPAEHPTGYAAPKALLLNSNEVASAKVGEVRLRASGGVPSDARLSLRCTSGESRVRQVYVTRQDPGDGGTNALETVVGVEGISASESVGDVQLEAVCAHGGRAHVFARSRLTVVQVGGVVFPDVPDGLPVVAPETRVPLGIEVFPEEAKRFLHVAYHVRPVRDGGTSEPWEFLAYGDPYDLQAVFVPPSNGVWQVKADVGLWSEDGPDGEDERDRLGGTDLPACVYVPGKPRLVFDYDRDGQIGTNDVAKAKEGRVFRFWINDDHDSGDVCDGRDYSSDFPGRYANCRQYGVDGRRDLVDFTPVWIDFSEVFPAGTPSNVWNQVEWRLVSSCANAVWTSFSRDDAGGFQRSDRGGCGENLIQSAHEAGTMVLDGEGAVLPSGFMDLVRQDVGKGVVLIEGCGGRPGLSLVGVGRLMNEVVRGDANLVVSSVEDMYRWVNLRYFCGDDSGRTSAADSPRNRPDDECDGRQFVFVHGFNVNAEEARAAAAEMFKRLWQSGSESMFTAVEWFGNQEQFTDPVRGTVSLNYYANVLHAFESAPELANACESLPGRKVMLAHSLGNMLVSSAAVDHGLAYARYYMLNAAVPMEAYDGTEHAEDMVDPDWATNNVPAVFRASRWNGLFGPEDFRSALSWRGRFAGISNAVNCYSETEDVVGNPRELTVSLTRADWAIRQSSWVAQEALKGTSVLNAINIWPWSHIGCEGGWGRSAHYPLWCASGSTLGLSDLTREGVIENPLFTPFRNETERMSSTNLFSATDAAATPQLRARFLADAIPAESHAAGANYLRVLNRDGNVSLMGLMVNSDMWPDKDRFDNPLWTHSAFKNLAYFFVYRLFDKIVTE